LKEQDKYLNLALKILLKKNPRNCMSNILTSKNNMERKTKLMK